MIRDGFGSVWKHHYTRLPEMPASAVPEPYDDSSKEAIGAFLIFDRFFDKPETAIEDWLVKSACWARRSWILNTDAVQRQIPLVFYVEEAIADRVVPLLHQNHVDVHKDTLFFDASEYQESVHHHFDGAGGKQCAIYSDEQFLGYEWVFQIDADMFMARPQVGLAPKEWSTYPFFEWFAGEYVRKSLGDFACVHLHGEKRIGGMQWPVLRRSGQPDSREEWYALASRLSDRNIDSGSWFRGLSAAITAFRRGSVEPAYLKWMTRAGREIQSDEALFGLMYFMGIPVWGLMNEMGLDGVWDVADLHRIRNKGHFYLAHMGLPHEWDWRADIGVDDV